MFQQRSIFFLSSVFSYYRVPFWTPQQECQECEENESMSWLVVALLELKENFKL